MIRTLRLCSGLRQRLRNSVRCDVAHRETYIVYFCISARASDCFEVDDGLQTAYRNIYIRRGCDNACSTGCKMLAFVRAATTPASTRAATMPVRTLERLQQRLREGQAATMDNGCHTCASVIATFPIRFDSRYGSNLSAQSGVWNVLGWRLG